MLSQTQSINNFIKNCDELISSNYVLATKKIGDLLRGLSMSKLFMELFEHLTSDFDYEEAKSKAMQTKSFEGGGFAVPTDRREFLALTFLLLYEIDLEKIKFIDFITMYFNGGGYKESYTNFCNLVIEPFKSEVLITIKQMQNGSLVDERVVTIKEIVPIFKHNDLSKIENLLRKSNAIIFQYKMDPKIRSELLTLYEDFMTAIYGNDPYRIKVAFLGYKYSTLYHRKLDVFVGEIEKILQDNNILDN